MAALLDEGRAAIVDARNPADMLRSLASSSGFNPEEDVARLSILQVPDLVALFDENAGSDLRSMIEWANRLANQPGADTLKANMAAAMNQIASRSPMREDRLRSWGFLPQPESAGGVK